jgi:uncharacterized protein (TIGR02147 family)
VEYLKAHLKSQPKHGHGLLKQWAEVLSIHTSHLSQIMNESRNFTEEQALDLVSLLLLPKLEGEYFMALVGYKNASTKRLRDYYLQKIEVLKKQSEKISERVTTDKNLSDEEKAIFYSSWIYSAVRVACSLEQGRTHGKTIEELHREFRIQTKDLVKIVDFLREAQMLIAEGNRFVVGSRFTHLEKVSIFLPKHHTNWRLQAIERSSLLSDEELMYTAPFSISKKHFAEFREKCLLYIQEFVKTARESTPEEMACFNMDLFMIKS